MNYPVLQNGKLRISDVAEVLLETGAVAPALKRTRISAASSKSTLEATKVARGACDEQCAKDYAGWKKAPRAASFAWAKARGINISDPSGSQPERRG